MSNFCNFFIYQIVYQLLIILKKGKKNIIEQFLYDSCFKFIIFGTQWSELQYLNQFVIYTKKIKTKIILEYNIYLLNFTRMISFD